MTVEEMESVLDRLGIEVISITGDEIKGHCPAHKERTGKEDSNPSWFINADSGVHHCFSCGFRGSVHSLVAYTQGVNYDDASSWLGSGERNLSKAFARLTDRPVLEEYQNPITESMLSAFVDPPADALASRGLTLASAQKYQILWDKLKSTWIIPIRDAATNELIGWQEKGYGNRYFNNYPKGMKKSVTVFGIQQYTSGTMVVVESPLDVVRLDSVGITGAVATYGCSVSRAQVNVIRGADRIVFAMDNDKAGRKGSYELLAAAKEMGFEAWFFDYSHTDMKDVGGMSKAEIVSGLENAKHSIHGKKAIGSSY